MGARWSIKSFMPRRHEDTISSHKDTKTQSHQFRLGALVPSWRLVFKTWCLGAFVALSQPGCMSVGSLVKELAHDPATVSVQVMTPYGSLKFVRTNPSTNQSVVVDPTGIITIKP